MLYVTGVPAQPKKTVQILLRLEDEMSKDFEAALTASGLTAQDALRSAAQAMIEAHRKFGRIPRDMEIRQSQIGDLSDIRELLERVQSVAEAQAPYLATKTPKKPPIGPKKIIRGAGTRPIALVSDRPA